MMEQHDASFEDVGTTTGEWPVAPWERESPAPGRGPTSDMASIPGRWPRPSAPTSRPARGATPARPASRPTAACKLRH